MIQTRKVLLWALTATTASMLLSSCVVGRKKYDALAKSKTASDKATAMCDSSLNSVTRKFSQLKLDTTRLGGSLRSRNGEYSQLAGNYDKLLSSSSSEAANLSKNLQMKGAEASKLAKDLADREKRVKELEKVLADKDKAVQALKDKVSGALLNFKENDLTVNVKNGKVYVSLSEQLLFKSGKYDVDPKGLDALRKLGNVLKQDQDINVTVEGHTDDVPLNGRTTAPVDNWDLSVLRATSITRFLTQEGVTGAKLIASGRSEYLPLNPAKTSEARTKNRRTEIILTPKLDELFQILGN